MRILFVMQTMRARGAERVASVLVEQFAKMPHEIFLICTGFERGDEFPIPDNIHFELIPEAEGIRLRLMFVRIRYIRRKIKEIRPDCIVSLAYARTLFMITAANAFSCVPMIFSERHDPIHNPKSKFDRLLRLISYRACDSVVFQTVGARDFFPEAIRRKGTIIVNPIMEGLPDSRNNARKPYIATFCKLDPQKNLSLLLRSFKKVSDIRPELRLVIYGDGILKNRLVQEAEELNILAKTAFHPHSLNVHEQISDCSLFVSSSDYEGQSNSMLEAMAMGLPCVCTDCPSGGASAVIENGVNGLLVPVGDEDKLAEAIRYMLDHPEEAHRMGNNAFRIRSERKPETIAREWEQLLIRIVSGR